MCSIGSAPEVLQRVRLAARGLDAGDPAAEAALDALASDTEAPQGPAERLARLAVGALVARARGGAADTGNLYGGAAGPAEMLEAFEVFARDLPLARFAHAAANAAIQAATRGASRVRIVDVGLGGGGQWAPLLEAWARRPEGPPAVRLVGVDLPTPGEAPDAALSAVGARLAAQAERLGVPFQFDAVPGRIEEITLPSAIPGEALVINAAFSLHHTGPQDRDGVLRRLAATGARALVLCEPEADHDGPAFPERLDAALLHYGLIFEVLERCLSTQPAARAVIEGQFFGREIHNVLVGEGAARVERHAPASDWGDRLSAAGLRPLLAAPVAVPTLPEGVSVEARPGGWGLTVDGQPLVMACAWGPNEA